MTRSACTSPNPFLSGLFAATRAFFSFSSTRLGLILCILVAFLVPSLVSCTNESLRTTEVNPSLRTKKDPEPFSPQHPSTSTPGFFARPTTWVPALEPTIWTADLGAKPAASESFYPEIPKIENHEIHLQGEADKREPIESYDIRLIRSIIQGESSNTTGKKLVFFTFDDGVNPISTPRILDVLKKEQIPATFFIVGNTLVERNREILLRIQKEGHAIGLHSLTHDYQQLYPGRLANAKEIRRQAEVTMNALKSFLGDEFSTRLWRYPGGHMSWRGMDAADNVLKTCGLEWIDWNGMAGLADIPERRPKSVEGVLAYLRNTLRYSPTQSVYVLLLHDTSDKLLIPESLPTLIQFFRARGYQFARLN